MAKIKDIEWKKVYVRAILSREKTRTRHLSLCKCTIFLTLWRICECMFYVSHESEKDVYPTIIQVVNICLNEEKRIVWCNLRSQQWHVRAMTRHGYSYNA